MKSQEDLVFIKDLFEQTKEQLSLLTKIIKQLEMTFRRNPNDDLVEVDLQEIHDSLQSLNQCLCFSSSEQINED
jgi:hypothetical protein